MTSMMSARNLFFQSHLLNTVVIFRIFQFQF